MLATVFTMMLDASDEVGLVLAWNILQCFGHDLDLNNDGKIDKDEIAAFKGIFEVQSQVRPCLPRRRVAVEPIVERRSSAVEHFDVRPTHRPID